MKRPIDLPRVRRALGLLDALADTHPQLLGEPGGDNRAGWQQTLQEIQMNHDKQFALRLPHELIVRLDAEVERQKAARPGMRVTRADVMRLLVIAGLDQVDRQLQERTAGVDDPGRI